MAKIADTERILRLIRNSDGVPSPRIKSTLNLSDERYDKVRQELLDDGLVEKYVTRGGGLRITRKGEKEDIADQEPASAFDNEAALYGPFAELLGNQEQDEATRSVVCRTHSLKAAGKWQNPDLATITIESFVHLRKTKIRVTTYEVKQFFRWNVEAVFEAASHNRFAHESLVALEWPAGTPFSLTDPTYKIDQLVRECQRFGIGLATLEMHDAGLRFDVRLEAVQRSPADEEVESWLDLVFSRQPDRAKAYDEAMRLVRII